MAEVAYASASGIFHDALKLLLPPKRRTVAEYAVDRRLLKSKSGAGLERWRNEVVPYLVEPSECLTSEEYLTVVEVGPGQCGKTSVAENWLGHSIEEDPGDMLWYMQTDKAVEAYVKERIDPMIEVHEGLKSRLGKKAVDDSLGFKNFVLMTVGFYSATPSESYQSHGT